MRWVSDDERRARLGRRHLLADPGTDPAMVARSLVALHSSDPTTVVLSTWARVPGFDVVDLETALYENRSLVRFYGMRRTLWVVDRDLVDVIHSSTTRFIGEKERDRTARVLEQGGITEDGAAWLDRVAPRTLEAIRRRGEVLARDLTKEIPELADQIVFYNRAGRVMGRTGLSTRVLFLLSLESRVIRARPAGTWVSGQYRWAETENWLGGPIEERPSEVSRARLVGDWLRAFGPGTEADIKWWTGWPLRDVREALVQVGAVEVETTAGPGYLSPDDVEPVQPPGPWVALLPSLDPTTMGWKERDWYLGDSQAILFDRNGNAGPTIWVDGRVVGGWTQNRDGEIRYEVFADVGAEARTATGERAALLEGWLGGTRVIARFRSPHDKKLAG